MKVKKISMDDFTKFTKIGKPLAKSAADIIAEAKSLPVKSGFLIEGWDQKTRPVNYVRMALGRDGKKFSERRLPEAGQFAILRTK